MVFLFMFAPKNSYKTNKNLYRGLITIKTVVYGYVNNPR